MTTSGAPHEPAPAPPPAKAALAAPPDASAPPAPAQPWHRHGPWAWVGPMLDFMSPRSWRLRSGCAPIAIVLAIALVLGSLVYQTGRDLAARLFAEEAVLRGDGYEVKLTYPARLWFSDAGARGALLTARLDGLPSPTPTPTAATQALTPTAAPTPAQAPAPDLTATAATAAVSGTQAIAEGLSPPPIASPTSEPLYTLLFSSEGELIFTDATGHPAPPRLALTAPEGRQPTGALYLRAAHLPALQGQTITLTARLQPPAGPIVPLHTNPGAALSIRLESRPLLEARTYADRVLGDQAFLIGIVLAVIGWAIEAVRRSSDERQTAMRERIAELNAMVDIDLASAILEHRKLSAAHPGAEAKEQLQQVERRLKLKQTATFAAALLAEAGARLGEGQIGRCDEVLEACGLQFSELQPHTEAIRKLLNPTYHELKNDDKKKVRRELLSALHKLWHTDHEHAYQLCILLFERLIEGTGVMSQAERESFEEELELVFLGATGPKDQLMFRKQQQTSLTLLRDVRLRNYPIIAHVIRRGSDRPQLWTPLWPAYPPEAPPPISQADFRFLSEMYVNWRELQLHGDFTAQILVDALGQHLGTEENPLAFSETMALCSAVALRLANLSLASQQPEIPSLGAEASCFPVWLRLLQHDPLEGRELSLLRRIAASACDSWWRLMATVEGVGAILDLPPAAQHQLGRLLVWNVGSLPAFAARLAQRAHPEGSTLEYQQLERRVSEALAGERLPRLNQGDLLAALAIRPPGRNAATLILVELQPETAIVPQLEQLCSLAPLLAREKALLRFFAPPEARAMLAGLGLGVVAWPEPMLQQLADYYVQRASEQGVFERYEDLRSYGIPLPHLQDLVRDADGSPTRLLADLRAALIKAAGTPAAP